MQYFNWYKQCPYAQLYSYPTVNRQYNYSMPWSYGMYDNTGIDNEYLSEVEGLDRAQRDIERVLSMIYQRTANEMNQAIALGMKPRLVAYLIREMVEYIDRNYDQYSKSASYNITEASGGIKTSLYWIFNIFRIYGVPFEVQNDLLSKTVITSIQNLRVSPNNITT